MKYLELISISAKFECGIWVFITFLKSNWHLKQSFEWVFESIQLNPLDIVLIPVENEIKSRISFLLHSIVLNECVNFFYEHSVKSAAFLSLFFLWLYQILRCCSTEPLEIRSFYLVGVTKSKAKIYKTVPLKSNRKKIYENFYRKCSYFPLLRICMCMNEHVHVKPWWLWNGKLVWERKREPKNTLYDGKDSHK